MLPFVVEVRRGGLWASLPREPESPEVAVVGVLSRERGVRLGCAGRAASSYRIVAWDALSVSVEWRAEGGEGGGGEAALYRAPLVRGMPYATVSYGSGACRAPLVEFLHGSILSLNGQAAAAGRLEASGTRFEVRLDTGVRSEGEGALLMMALPHQLAGLAAAAEKGGWAGELLPELAQWSAKGTSLGVANSYGTGKEVGALGRLALIADELGEADAAATVRGRLAAALDAWLDCDGGKAPCRFSYDRSWGGVVPTEALADPAASFGVGWHNDKHFHYGYFLYAAAALGRANTTWLAARTPALLTLVADVASPSASDRRFPPLRHFDAFCGHSWALGLFASSAGRNQESVSEALNAWHGIALLGLALRNERLVSLGRLLAAVETQAAAVYYHAGASPVAWGSASFVPRVYPPRWPRDGVVGNLWGLKAEASTWFGREDYFIFGIQVIPLTPQASEPLLDQKWVAASRASWETSMRRLPAKDETWRAFLVAMLAKLEAQARVEGEERLEAALPAAVRVFGTFTEDEVLEAAATAGGALLVSAVVVGMWLWAAGRQRARLGPLASRAGRDVDFAAWLALGGPTGNELAATPPTRGSARRSGSRGSRAAQSSCCNSASVHGASLHGAFERSLASDAASAQLVQHFKVTPTSGSASAAQRYQQLEIGTDSAPSSPH
ncbi:hypothetical protein EMIHUDRAFT_245898 [Emiliania huxleyi CCMP1516]|uniref:glucan endo-1,3-beta-D-glucosidase n=2 Tax=Emiliania huxleyi TaxID=2903 RepID=A0A0D3IVG5_EMIH1|nr:hypothetical protein EMIHUDRAFT_245898 [Emiliania huxleyi CCMP1516]EOD15250.1 hypothetical protein EMIHUDRAFT_245898 [Emiliania huxleyi CCMP1516]|eukprot:XP_005767679.1 hypothetical protein EMIHUDRAFT_245898 [Emiliania huxleyi CCMP1516]